MRKISLKWKIYAIGFIPFSFFLLSVCFTIKEDYLTYVEAKLLVAKVLVIENISNLVHETQKERGYSAGFLNGGVKLSVLKKQHVINDEKKAKLRKNLKKSIFEKPYQNEVLAELDKLDEVRGRVISKSILLSEVLKGYTIIIQRLLDVELDVASSTQIPTLGAKLRSYRILEDAKESGGKLRANITGILAKDKEISSKKFSTIISLKAGVNEGIVSSGLRLNERSMEYISSFQNSDDWATVNDIFESVLKKSDIGNYGYGPEEFFSGITRALNILGELITYEKEVIIALIIEIKDQAQSSLWRIFIMVGLTVVALSFFVSFTSNSIIKKIKTVISSLGGSADAVSHSSEDISVSSIKLSEATTEQASSLQETVSSINEISSMVQKNSEAAEQSTSVSEKSKVEATKGKESVDVMIKEIKDISKTNDNIKVEMKNSNDQISKITLVISSIAEKTKVINDIVFQTKLLSFNASVEAARAGEHGKGFAVVAEEIGNLASMSGTAALEISEMLEASIKEVNAIVNTSREKIDILIDQSKENSERGTKTAQLCGVALESILNNVALVNDIVKEISTASSEQAAGVAEVTTAMQQLDQVTHQNNHSAQASASLASQLKRSAGNMEESIKELTSLVNG
jgi:methyl-accepting chemotaxis protein